MNRCKKIAYSSEKQAKEYASLYYKELGGVTTSYKCKCGYYHLTSQKAKRGLISVTNWKRVKGDLPLPRIEVRLYK